MGISESAPPVVGQKVRFVDGGTPVVVRNDTVFEQRRTYPRLGVGFAVSWLSIFHAKKPESNLHGNLNCE